MWIDQTNAGKRVNQRSQAGAGTYAILVAVVLSAAATMVVVDGTPGTTSAPMVPTFPEGGAMYLEAQSEQAQRAAKAPADTAESGVETTGSELTKDQPGYDEAAAISIYTR